MTRRNRIAAIVASVVFFVLVGTTGATALWSTTASTGASVKVATLSTGCGSTAMVNASFEDPALPGTLGYAEDGTMPGWRAKNAAGNPVRIEIWRGYDNVAAGTGNQHVELNADVPGTLYQTLNTIPGQTLQWSLMHRGRSGTDTMQLFIGAENAAGVSQGNFSDDNTAWRRYSGAYVVPAGQTRTTLAFQAVSAAGGDSIGNFLDDVSFGSGPCLNSATTLDNITNPGGAYRPGDIVEYTSVVTNSGSSFSQNTVYAAVVPTGLTYNTGTITINGTGRTDALSDDEANYVTADRTIFARLGTGASSTAGGTIAQNTQTVTVKYRATIPAGSAGSTITFSPTVTYANGLASGWGLAATSNTVSMTVSNGADLAVAIVATPTTVQKATSNTAVSWVVTLTNNGPLASGAGATVTIAIPNTGVASTVVPVTATGANCAPISSGQSVCTISAAMASGATRTFTISRSVAAAQAVGSTYTLTATAASSVFDPTSGNNSASSVITVVDTIAPSTPGQPTPTATTATTTALTWTASTDVAGVTAYDIYRNGVLVGSSATNTYTSTGLTAWTAYTYTIVARDQAGNSSAASTAGVIVAAPNSVYRISRDPVGGDGLYCIVAPNTNNGSTLVMSATCGSTDVRNWTFVADGDGRVKVKMANQARYWTIATNAASGAAITSSAAVTTTNQEWIVIPRGGSLYSFQSASNPALCIERTATTTIQMRACDANDAPQQFDLTVR